MALSDSVTPEVTPLGSPAGRFEASPLTDTKMGPQQFVDRFAREDVGGMDNFSDIPEPNKIPTEIDSKMVHSAGTHNLEKSATFGTFNPAQLSQNDPFGDL